MAVEKHGVSTTYKPPTVTLDDERAVPGLSDPGNLRSHLARYRFVQQWVQPHHHVLETACGAGYGTQMLARRGKWVLGVDYSPMAIAHARAHYPASNLAFTLMDCQTLGLRDRSFDIVISLEVFEHLAQWQCYLRECARVLRSGGLLLLSTPNRATWDIHMGSIAQEYEFHINMVELADLQKALQRDFSICAIYGQRRRGSRLYGALRAVDILNLRLRLFSHQRRQRLQESLGVAPMPSDDAGEFVFTPSQLRQANHFVAVCRKP